MFQSILDANSGNFSVGQVLACTATSVALGIIISLIFQFRNKTTRGMAMALVLLPALVQMVIMMVNGNVGTGVAIMGAFGLVRFRSNPGNAKDIISVFFSMAVGLATGMGYLTFAVFMVGLIGIVFLALSYMGFGKQRGETKQLHITIPENLNYTDMFDDLFEKYTSHVELERVKTTNMGSMFEISYKIILHTDALEKELIDAIRCRNGNLAISCGVVMENQSAL